MSIQIVNVDKKRNRIYLRDCADNHVDDVIRNATKILQGAGILRPGFGVIVSIPTIYTISPFVARMNSTVIKYLAKRGMSRCIIVNPGNIKCSALSIDCFFGIHADIVKSISEAEQLVDTE